MRGSGPTRPGGPPPPPVPLPPDPTPIRARLSYFLATIGFLITLAAGVDLILLSWSVNR